MSETGQEASTTGGGGAPALTGWNAQKLRAAAANRASVRFGTAASTRASGQGRPSSTQRTRVATSRSASFCLGGIRGSS